MKLKANFTVPTKDLKGFESIELPIYVNIEENGQVFKDPEYSVVLPDFMFNELANTESRFRTEYDQNNRSILGLFSERTLTPKFKKTQTSRSINSLMEYFSNLTGIINERHSIEKETLTKKIFIRFSHSRLHTRSNRNAAYRGEEIRQSFNYFIGYEVITSQFNKLFEGKKEQKKYVVKIEYQPPGGSLRKRDTGFQEDPNLFLQPLHEGQTMSGFESEYSIIDWTEEREKFCERIKETFSNINHQLEDFLKNIDDNKMEELMSGNTLRFLQP